MSIFLLFSISLEINSRLCFPKIAFLYKSRGRLLHPHGVEICVYGLRAFGLSITISKLHISTGSNGCGSYYLLVSYTCMHLL